jgi:hypothetical protein
MSTKALACMRIGQISCPPMLLTCLMLTHATAGLDRELLQLKREETRLVKEIKACAAKGNQPATRQLAKSLVRIRQQVRLAVVTCSLACTAPSQVGHSTFSRRVTIVLLSTTCRWTG